MCGRFLSFGSVLKHADYFLNSRAELRLNCERGHHSFLSRTWPCLRYKASLGTLGQGHCGLSVLLCRVQQDPGATCLIPALMEELPLLRLSSFFPQEKADPGHWVGLAHTESEPVLVLALVGAWCLVLITPFQLYSFASKKNNLIPTSIPIPNSK